MRKVHSTERDAEPDFFREKDMAGEILVKYIDLKAKLYNEIYYTLMNDLQNKVQHRCLGRDESRFLLNWRDRDIAQ